VGIPPRCRSTVTRISAHLKLKRHAITVKYADVIETLYTAAEEPA
jgi:hypothetical protein